MQILFTATSLVILIGCFLAYTRAQKEADNAESWRQNIETNAIRANEDRSRLTGLERDVDALRRELRKLSGNFYAFKTKVEDDADEMFDEVDEEPRLGYGDGNVDQRSFALTASICDNWSIAQRDGPRSEAASCECSYCVARRAERRRLRGELVPKTVQGQAELARLNAGKP